MAKRNKRRKKTPPKSTRSKAPNPPSARTPKGGAEPSTSDAAAPSATGAAPSRDGKASRGAASVAIGRAARGASGVDGWDRLDPETTGLSLEEVKEEAYKAERRSLDQRYGEVAQRFEALRRREARGWLARLFLGPGEDPLAPRPAFAAWEAARNGPGVAENAAEPSTVAMPTPASTMELDALRERIQELRADLEEARAAKERQAAAVEQTLKERDEARAIRADLEAEVEHLDSLHKAAVAETDALRAGRQSALDDAATDRNEVERLKDEIAVLQAKLEEAESLKHGADLRQEGLQAVEKELREKEEAIAQRNTEILEKEAELQAWEARLADAEATAPEPEEAAEEVAEEPPLDDDGKEAKRQQRMQESFWKGLDRRAFARELGQVYTGIGYAVERVGGAGDEQPVDLSLSKGTETTLVSCVVEASEPLGIAAIKALRTAMDEAEAARGVLVTRSGFTLKAADFAARRDVQPLQIEEIMGMDAQGGYFVE